MRVRTLSLTNFRSFQQSDPIEFGQMNVLVGANNAGKSSILRALALLQVGFPSQVPDVRVGSKHATVSIALTDIGQRPAWGSLPGPGENATFQADITSLDRRIGDTHFHLWHDNGQNKSVPALPNIEPNHFIVPYLSKRKTAAYQEDIRLEATLRIDSTLSYLAAKLSRVSNPQFPGYKQYSEACEAILGFVVTNTPSDNGQRPGAYLPSKEFIPIDQMGEGVPNIVGLLADISLSQGKLFLVEEPENDLHPRALKALLEMMIQSSSDNQFVVSTHSNIVVRYLAAAEGSRLFSVTAESESLPMTASIKLIPPTAEARIEVLRDLGYSFSDFDLWDGWLILEESSAERIIRDYLIPWFTPKLSRVRTIATGGDSQVEPTFDDFNRLVLFTHLEAAYRNAAWVRIDAGSKGAGIVSRLKARYPSWEPSRFQQFSEAQFELYYPKHFKAQIDSVLSLADPKVRREEKKKLLGDVRQWLDEDETRGREALSQSASEIIADLKQIEIELISKAVY